MNETRCCRKRLPTLYVLNHRSGDTTYVEIRNGQLIISSGHELDPYYLDIKYCPMCGQPLVRCVDSCRV